MSSDRKLRVCLMPACRGQRRDLVHKFPMNNLRAEQWLQIINDPKLLNEPLNSIRKKHFICNRHFRQQDYKNVESRSLNTTAVPSLLLERTATTQETAAAAAAAAATSDTDDTTVIYLQTAPADDAEEADTGSSSRLEFSFDTVEVVHTSDLQITRNCSSSSEGDGTPTTAIEYMEHVGLSDDDLLEEGIISILEPSLDKANTYRLSTITKTVKETNNHQHQQQQQQSAMIVDQSDEYVQQCTTTVTVDNNDDDVNADDDGHASNDEHETSDVLLIPLSSESFLNLQNRLLQQQSQPGSEKSKEIVLDDILMECNRGDIVRAGHRFNNGDLVRREDMSPSASFDSITTTVTHPSWPQSLQICNFWLRDHCRCALCYNGDTFQRKQNVLDIPLTIKPQSCAIAPDSSELRITWPDQHESVYDLSALRAHYGDVIAARTALRPVTERYLWTGDDIQKQPYARVTLNDLLCDDAVARAILTSLVRYGLAFIEKVPANLQSTEVAIKRLFAVHKTLFGEMWSLTDAPEHADTAYSKTHLGAHTDNTYFNDAAGLQVLHCVNHTGTGGESLLLDGFQAVHALRQRNAAAVERLSVTNVPAEYLEDGQHHTYEAPIVRRTPDGTDLEQLRFNLYDRAPMTAMPPAEMLQFYTDLRQLTAEIQAPANEWWFKLQPGTVVIFDNWRVLHGRAAYTGRRQLVGCYVSRTEFQSVARTMGVIR